MIPSYIKKLYLVALLIVAGILLEVAGLLDVENMLGIAREYVDRWWLVLILILLQMMMKLLKELNS